jgi:simple sugar transport system ATP-binding protein
MEWLLEAKGISKRFGSVVALKKVDLSVGYNECVGLLGDNGAGKSTLIKCIVGAYQRDEGEIYFEGKKVHFSSPAEARAMGIDIVYQDANLIDLMNVWRNFFLGKELSKVYGPIRFLNVNRMRQETISRIIDLKIKIRSPDEEVGVMSGGERQSIAIARANYFGGKLLILDEPLTALSVVEREKVIKIIKEFKLSGTSFIYITHNIYEVFPIADRFEILDKGIKIASLKKEKDLKPEDIIDIIVKRKI